eukprot:Gb_03926 [translate_table: standard]
MRPMIIVQLRAEDANNPSSYVFTFGEDAARYLPLPTKLVLQKRRAKEGRSGDDIDSQYPVPSRVTVRHRPLTHKEEELRDSGRALLMEVIVYPFYIDALLIEVIVYSLANY